MSMHKSFIKSTEFYAKTNDTNNSSELKLSVFPSWIRTRKHHTDTDGYPKMAVDAALIPRMVS